MAEVHATIMRLLIVQEIEADENGTVLRFQEGSQGHLILGDANYATHLRLARRSRERQHPVGIRFGEGQAITELIRADNDVPLQIWEDAEAARMLFQGHDGVFCLRRDHLEFARIRALLDAAIRQRARVWFIAPQPDLALLDVVPAGSGVTPAHVAVSDHSMVTLGRDSHRGGYGMG